MRNELLGPTRAASRQPAHRRTQRRHTLSAERGCVPRRLALMFTDIVDSTPLLVEAGDEGWLAILLWHNALLRAAFRTHAGREVKDTGDGFFVVFERPLPALRCALRIQEELAAGRGRHGYAVHVRIGIQWVEVLETHEGFVGRGVHEAARINEAAAADEILVSVAAFQAAGREFPRSGARPVSLRGLPEPLQLVSLQAGARTGAAGVSAPVTPDR